MTTQKSLMSPSAADAGAVAAGSTEDIGHSSSDPVNSSKTTSNNINSNNTNNSRTSHNNNRRIVLYGFGVVCLALSVKLVRGFSSLFSLDVRETTKAGILLAIHADRIFFGFCGLTFFFICLATIAYNAHIAHNIRLLRFVVALVNQQQQQQNQQENDMNVVLHQQKQERDSKEEIKHFEKEQEEETGYDECCCSDEEENKEKIGILFVTAHPDDESLFFAPSISLFSSKKETFEVFILCLSSGDYEGLGLLRERELSSAAKAFSLSVENVVCINDENLKDGWKEWEEEDVKNHVKEFLNKHSNIQLVFTFDAQGVSGHPNHRSVYKGVRRLNASFLAACKTPLPSTQKSAQQSKNQQLNDHHQSNDHQQSNDQQQSAQQSENQQQVQGKHQQQQHLLLLPRVFFFCLKTHGRVRKYSGLLNIIPATVDSNRKSFDVATCLWPSAALKGLLCHSSQLVWYRFLFVFFSSYSYTNVYAPME